MVVTFLCSLVQSCCGEGRTLQTNISGICGECSQCFSHTGFAPAHGVCAFMVYTVQALDCSAGNCLRHALGCMHFPGLSHSGSGSWVLHKGTDSFGPLFCALPRSKQLRWPGAWRAHCPRYTVCLITSLAPAAWFPGCTIRVLSQVCHASPLGSWSQAVTLLADIHHPESQEDLVSNWEPAHNLVEDAISGAKVAPCLLALAVACLPHFL